jgi:dTDP-4-amino-4,6-dideoxygalactose transaminase
MVLSYNCLSSTSAIANVGAKPVWIDINPDTATVSVPDLDNAMSRSTKALVVYHVAGYPASLQELRRWCDMRSVSLIEDANCAFGAMVEGHRVGTVGDFAVFSFYANRQINAIEGAVLVCANPASAEIARRLRKFGIDQARFRDIDGEIDANCDVPVIGVSAALSNAHAALALSALKDIDHRLAAVRRNVGWLNDEAPTFPTVQPVSWSRDDKPAFWVWLVRSRHRHAVMSELKSMGVGCSKLHHPNHLYSGFSSDLRSLPGTRVFAEEGFALPCGWWLGESQVGRIIDALRTVSRKH